FECGKGKVAWLGIKPHRILSFAITKVAMASGTIAAIICCCIFCMSGEFTDMRFHSQVFVFLVLGDLRRGEAANRQHCYCARDKVQMLCTHCLLLRNRNQSPTSGCCWRGRCRRERPRVAESRSTRCATQIRRGCS